MGKRKRKIRRRKTGNPVKKILRVTINSILLFVAACFLLSLLLVLIYRFVSPPVTPLMIIRYFDNGSGINKDWTGYDKISDYMKLAVIAAEDQKFPLHKGFDMESIQDALSDKMEGKELRGASTISQQTAKNLFLWPSRSWSRKGLEAYFTFLIENLWDKRRILEVYLNVIETGDGVYGVQAASMRYFGKNARNLNSAESALIAAVLPNPLVMSPARPSSYVSGRQRWIMGQMSNLGTGYLQKIE